MSDRFRLSFGLVASNDAPTSPFEALATWFSEHTDLELSERVAKSYEDLAMSIREGTSDIGWLPPVVYARMAEGVEPLGSIAREGKTSYAAAVLVLESSDLRGLDDLAGARAGWVDPWSAAGFVVPRLELARRGTDPTSTFRTEQFFGTHRDTLLALGRGDCDVACTFARESEAPDAKTVGPWTEMPELSVRVLATFGPIPTDVIAVRRNLAPRDYEAVTAALRKASQDPDARPLLRAVFGGEELREGLESGHEELRHAYERAVASGLFD
jgi:phosphate/phosphite/phosphonate ABC transporter binding protein